MNLTKVESFYIFLKAPDEIQKYVKIIQSNSSDNCVHCHNIEINIEIILRIFLIQKTN